MTAYYNQLSMPTLIYWNGFATILVVNKPNRLLVFDLIDYWFVDSEKRSQARTNFVLFIVCGWITTSSKQATV